MATVHEVIHELQEEAQLLNMTEQDKEVMGNIQSIVLELRGTGISGKDFKDYSPDELSRIGGSLAILTVNLGEMISRAQRNFKLNEELARYKKASVREVVQGEIRTTKSKEPTVAEVDAGVTKQTFRENIRTTFSEEHLTKLQNTWWSIKSLLESIDKRIVVVSSEMKNENYASWATAEAPLPPTMVVTDPGIAPKTPEIN